MEQYTKFATPTMSGCHMNCRMVHLLWKGCSNCARIGSKNGHWKTKWNSSQNEPAHFGQILSGRATDRRRPRLLGNWWQPHLKRKNNNKFLKERCWSTTGTARA